MGTTLVAAVAALLGVVVGGLVTARVQDRHWLRDQRLQGFIAFTTTSFALYDRLRQVDEMSLLADERLEWRNRVQAGRSAVHLLVGRETRDAMGTLMQLVQRPRRSQRFIATMPSSLH